ncbi:carbohydrate sulfotransferase 11-like [Pecten maximus]|uniref:carbohydrate sulfotransferase 11-like n=1 Tax=Pecten maximus TaxID=6579 RepID=UPI001458E5EA|nr:carbohydrate sulfotransferase 11-like [Pecten maximus]
MNMKTSLAILCINGFVFIILCSFLLVHPGPQNCTIEYSPEKDLANLDKKTEASNTSQTYYERQALLYKNCANAPKIGLKGRETLYFYAEANNLAFCKTPKSGSTFVGTVVSALKHREEFGNLFHANRESIHGRNEAKFSAIFSSTVVPVKLVLVVRNPYTRLFSAYIDKYSILAAWGKRLANVKQKGLFKMGAGYCGYNVSFEDMLDSVTTKAIIEEHTMTVTEICKPCTVHYDIICKQETLNTDTEYVLNAGNITESKRRAILKMIHGTTLNDTLFGWISSQLVYYKSFEHDCPDIILYMEKLWQALQSQGYIDLSLTFPAHEFKKLEKLEAEGLTTLILKLINTAPLSKSQMSMQKKRVLAEAYSRIKPATLARIKTMFAQDFSLFGYDTSVPV